MPAARSPGIAMRRRLRPGITLSVAVASAIVLLGGCGGEPGRAERSETVVTVVQGQTVAAPSGTARITDPARAAYVRKVDAVCRRRNPERDDDVRAAAEATDEAEAVSAYDRSIATAANQLDEIRAVTPPPGDRALITSNVLDRLQERLVLRRRLSAALATSDAAAASQARARLDALTTALESFARGYGFSVCGLK